MLKFTVITLGPCHISATRKIIFGSFSALSSEIERKKKRRENPEKETGVPVNLHAWETLENRVNTGIKQKNNREKEKEWTDERDRKDDLKTRLKRKRLSLFQFYIEKRKRRKKEKRDAGEGKENGAKMRSGLAIVRRTYRQVSGASSG